MTERVAVASGNESKAREIMAILAESCISVEFVKADLLEIQSDSLEQIASRKALDAYSQLKREVIVEDDGLFIDSLKGFPGPYSSYVFKTIGCTGILGLLRDIPAREARFLAVVAHYDGRNVPSLYTGMVGGSISTSMSVGGWGYDPIFVPVGNDMTFAQMGEMKNQFSHRRRALEEFAKSQLNRELSR